VLVFVAILGSGVSVAAWALSGAVVGAGVNSSGGMVAVGVGDEVGVLVGSGWQISSKVKSGGGKA
jgi:hypothetical protein